MRPFEDAFASHWHLDEVRSTPGLAGVEYHEQIPSTNTRALELAADPSLEVPYLVLAKSQTAGRGRGGNLWWSEQGAVTFSLIVEPRTEQSRWPQIALVMAVALLDALDEIDPDCRSRIKWPNDVWIEGKKVAGILVEVPSKYFHPTGILSEQRLVIGAGVNVNNRLDSAPELVQKTATSLAEEIGRSIPVTSFWQSLFQAFLLRLDQWREGKPSLIETWQSRAEFLGQEVRLEISGVEKRGRFVGIDENGGLLLDSGTGPEKIYSGTLFRAVKD